MTLTKNSVWRFIVLLVALALVVAACGSDDDDGEGETTEATEAPESTEGGDDGDDGESSETTEAADDGEMTETINLAVLSECEGPFGGFHNQQLAGVGAAFAEYAGATIVDPTDPLAGFTGATVNGVNIELVGIGCGDDTADTAIAETRRLMEQLGGEIMIGPLSGDESVAVANYALDHPTQTFVNGAAGAMDTTLDVQAPNFFRYHADGAQWNAGTGDIAKNTLGWDTAAVIMDDYSFGWTSAAGFIAEYCAAGGEVTSRVFPPLGATDYSSFAAQLPAPDEVDGYFWVVGGTGTTAAIKAFEDIHGSITPDQHMGNLFWEFAAGSLDPTLEGGYVGGFGTAADLALDSVDAHTAIIEKHWVEFPDPGGEVAAPGPQAHSGFLVNYFTAAKALIQGLEEVGGDISDDHAALQAALGGLTLEGPYGTITLDENRQAIQDSYVRQLVDTGDGVLGLQTVAVVPAVDQSFGGSFTKEGGMPSRDIPTCEARDIPWIGNLIEVVDGVPQG